MNVFFQRITGLSLALSFMLTLGCGEDAPPELAEVTGKVTYKGKPVPGGMIVFLSEDGKRFVSPIKRDGSFSLKSPLGPVKAAVVTRQPSGDGMNDNERPAVREVPPLPPGTDPKSLPPKNYERFETSGLSYEVTQSGQTIDVTLAD